MIPISVHRPTTHTQEKQDDTDQRAQPYNRIHRINRMMPIRVHNPATHTHDKRDDSDQRAQPCNTYTGYTG